MKQKTETLLALTTGLFLMWGIFLEMSNFAAYRLKIKSIYILFLAWL